MSRPKLDGTAYELFGIATDGDAKALKKAYHRLSREWHPENVRVNVTSSQVSTSLKKLKPPNTVPGAVCIGAIDLRLAHGVDLATQTVNMITHRNGAPTNCAIHWPTRCACMQSFGL